MCINLIVYDIFATNPSKLLGGIFLSTKLTFKGVKLEKTHTIFLRRVIENRWELK